MWAHSFWAASYWDAEFWHPPAGGAPPAVTDVLVVWISGDD